jgi:hypothetical protein
MKDLYLYQNQKLSIGQLSRLPECRCTEPTLRYRIKKLGWPIERAVTEETGITRKQIENDFGIATDKEAWRGLRPDQLEEMQEMERLCDTARWQ